MSNETLCFYDVEATSVSRDADIISIGIIAIQKNTIIKSIYCEFTDFNIAKCDDWVKENVISKLELVENIIINPNVIHYTDNNVKILGDEQNISNHLKEWLSQFNNPCFIADFDVIDKPLLIDLIADWNKVNLWVSDDGRTIYEDSKIGLPKHLPNIRYDQFFDLHSLFWLKGYDTDFDRNGFVFGIRLKTEKEIIYNYVDRVEEFNKLGLTPSKHNALWDAYVSYLCYKKLIEN